MPDKMNISESRLMALQIAQGVARELRVRHGAESKIRPRQIWKSAIVSSSDGGWSIESDIDNFPRHLSIRIVFPADPNIVAYWFEAKVTWPDESTKTSLVHGTLLQLFDGSLDFTSFVEESEDLAHA